MPHPTACSRLRSVRTLGGLALLLPALANASEIPDPGIRLFVGIEIEVMHEGDFRSVATISGRDAVVETDAGSAVLPFRSIRQVKFDYSTKLSPTVIRLENVTSERAYSPSRDPRWEARSQQTALQGYRQDQISVRQATIANATLLPINPDFGGPPGGNAAAPSPDFDPVGDAYAEYEEFRQSTEHFDSLDAYPTETDDVKGDGDYDAINVEFTISSPLPLTSPYVVAIARFRDAEQQLRDKFWFRKLDRIDERPRQVKMATAGLPPGFEIESVRLHVFRSGQEVATNESERQISLTPEEAHQYLILAHQTDHPKATMPAQPVWELAPRELWNQSAKQIEATTTRVAVWVDEKGRFMRVGADQIVPPNLLPMLDELFYLPALVDGRAVAGMAQVDFAQFSR